MAQVSVVDVDTARAIIAEVERTTPDDEMLAVGVALSSAVMPWMLDLVTAPGSPLRSGYSCIGWSDASAAPSRAAADPRVLAIETRLAVRYRRDANPNVELADGDALEFLVGYEEYIAGDRWIHHACDLAESGILDSEIALMVVIRGATWLWWNRGGEGALDDGSALAHASKLADAFERQRPTRSTLVLPPIIV